MSVVSQGETTSERRRVAVRPAATARSVLISMNPRAGSRWRQDSIHGIADSLRECGYDVQMTSALSELAKMAAEMQQLGELRAVLAIGGDGTASVVRNHVPLEIPMVVVPMGTENLLGRYVGQEIAPRAVCRTLEEGVIIELDLGRAGDKYFLLMISAGFDAEVIHRLHEMRRGNIRRSAYALPVLRTMRNYRFPEMRVYCDDPAGVAPVDCRWVFGFNLPLYALGLPIAPEAVGTDGLLDVCAFERGNTWSVMRYLWHVWFGGHLKLKDASLRHGRKFRLESPESASVAYQVDGDIGGTLPVEVEILPGQLRLLVPPAAAQRLGFDLPE